MKLIKGTLLTAAIGIASNSCAQPVLGLKKPLVLYTVPVSVALPVAGYFISNNVEPFAASDLNNLDRGRLSALDKKTTYKFSQSAANTSNLTAFMCAAIPAAMSFTPKIRKEFYTYNTVYGQCLLATIGQSMLLKGLVHKSRPYAYNENAPLDKRLSGEARLSFPSMHTSVSAAACFFAATTYCLYYPESGYKIPVWAGAVLLPLITGYLRNESGRHFYSDIAAGYLIGAANGIVFPLVFKLRN